MQVQKKKQTDAYLVEARDGFLIANFLVKYRYVLSFFAVIGVFSSFLLLFKAPTLYQASTTILLKSNSNNNVFKVGLLDESSEEVETKIQILQSFDLIQGVCQKLNLDKNYFIVGQVKTTEVWEDKFPFDLDIALFNQSLIGSLFSVKINPKDTKKFFLTYQKQGNPIITQYSFDNTIIRNEDFVLEISVKPFFKNHVDFLLNNEFLFSKNKRYETSKAYQKMLLVTNITGTNLVKMSLQDVVEEKANLFLETLIKSFEEHTRKNYQEEKSKKILLVEKEITRVQNTVDSSNIAIKFFQSKYEFIDLKQEQLFLLNQLETLEKNEEESVKKLNQFKNLRKNLKASRTQEQYEESVLTAVVSGENLLVRLIDELYFTEEQLLQARYNNTAKNHSVQELQKKADKLKKQINAYVANTQKEWEVKLQQIQDSRKELATRGKKLPEIAKNYADLIRKKELNENLFYALLQRRVEYIMDFQNTPTVAEIIETPKAEVVGKIKNKAIFYYPLLWIFIGFLMAWLHDVFFPYARSVRELQFKIDLPILATLPNFSLNKKDVHWRTLMQEDTINKTIQKLRSNILYQEKPYNNIIAVCSHEKTIEQDLFCIALAYSFSAIQRRVVLVDMDFAAPSFSSLLALKSENTINHYFQLAQMKLDSMIEPIHNFLHVIAAEESESKDIFGQPKTQTLLRELSERYDYVIINLPDVQNEPALETLLQQSKTLFFAQEKYLPLKLIHDIENIAKRSKNKDFYWVIEQKKISFFRGLLKKFW